MNKKPTGFTLLEILLALFIFTIISMIIVSALHTIFSSQTATEKSAAKFTQLQVAMTLLSRDFEQVINRPITNPTGIIEGAFVGTHNSVTFTHAGLTNPLGQMQRSTLQRTHYEIINEMLLRVTWPQLDQTTHTLADKRILLKHVSELEFQYLDQRGHFQTRWPPPDQTDKGALPQAVRVSVTVQDLGKISQLYIIPGHTFEKPN
jgi:general secretion pathway protein J